MTASPSVPSNSRAGWLLAAAWLLAHLPFLSPALEDIDSINFALGLHDFDPARHQPHPPGYPVFIAAGRVALAIVHALAPGLASVRADALALAIWSAIGGAIAIAAAYQLFGELTTAEDDRGGVAGWGALLMATVPLFWLTGLRPMSDMFGLGVALSAQVLLLRGSRDRRALMAGAVVAGLAAGIRVQTVPLTVPLFLYALFVQRRQSAAWLVTRPIAAFAAVVSAWAVPLVMLTGGIAGYRQALASQAGEDFAWVDMLWSHPTPRALAFALYDSFILPWGHPAYGALLLLLAVGGTVVLLWRDRRALLLLSIAFLPYAVFHLLFQEAANLRYSVSLVPPIAFLVTSGGRIRRRRVSERPLDRWRELRGARFAPLLLLVLFLIVHDVPLSLAYGGEMHPAFRAIADMTSAAASSRPAAVFSHYSLRRPLQAAPTNLPVIEPVRNYEWLGMEDYWLRGGRAEVWFLADPKRTDLALIDPQSRRPPGRARMTEYLWSVGDRPELMGTRPLAVRWYRFDPPGWFAAEGWELTPETAGIARASGKALQYQPITAYVRRRSGPMMALVAGRDLGPANDPPTMLEMALDGTTVATWRLDPSKDGINFFHVFELPAGIPVGVGDYARLTIAARAEQAGVRTPEIAVEQFDLQPANGLMFGFADGWQEAEYDSATGRAWRWTSDRATLRIVPATRTVTVRIVGESPLKYFKEAPTVRVLAGDREITVFHPDRDFDWRIRVPEDALVASGGAVTLTTDRVYLPGQAEGTGDARRLGLRVFDVSVVPAAP